MTTQSARELWLALLAILLITALYLLVVFRLGGVPGASDFFGHSLGITVHDVGMKLRPPRADNPFLRNTSKIEPGQVFTIEPGVYVIEGLLGPLRADDRKDLLDWAAIDELRPFGGIRIEDNIVVQEAGIRNLTREAFATM